MPTKMLPAKAEEVSQVMKSLGHPVRLKILCFLGDGEKTVNEIVKFCEISQSGVSQFLARMKLEGLLESEKKGQFAYYRILDGRMLKLMRALKEIYCTR